MLTLLEDDLTVTYDFYLKQLPSDNSKHSLDQKKIMII